MQALENGVAVVGQDLPFMKHLEKTKITIKVEGYEWKIWTQEFLRSPTLTVMP